MNHAKSIATLLLLAYPAAWRREYGEELLSILVAQPISMRIAVDVVGNGLWQRARSTQPWTLLGLASMAMLVGGVVLTPTSYGRTLTALVRPTSMTFPTFEVTFMSSDVYAMLLVACGCWTAVRSSETSRSSAWAAVKMSLIAGLPVTFGALLLATALIDVSFAGLVGGGSSPWAMMAALIVRLPEYALWGAVGGALGRWILRNRYEPA